MALVSLVKSNSMIITLWYISIGLWCYLAHRFTATEALLWPVAIAAGGFNK